MDQRLLHMLQAKAGVEACACATQQILDTCTPQIEGETYFFLKIWVAFKLFIEPGILALAGALQTLH